MEDLNTKTDKSQEANRTINYRPKFLLDLRGIQSKDDKDLVQFAKLSRLWIKVDASFCWSQTGLNVQEP